MKVSSNFSLQQYNTFGLDAMARDFIPISSVRQLQHCITSARRPFFILGGGSNMLLTQDLNATVLYNKIVGKEIVKENKNYIYVKIGGGENWHDTVQWAVRSGYGGIENLSLIPGSVGASPIQNIGAYGVELKDVFHELAAIKLTDGKAQIFQHKDCSFGYRSSVFKSKLKGQYFITYVTLKLTKNPQLNISYGAIKIQLENIAAPTIEDVSNAIITIRQSKLPDPAVLGNAGSFFKNPVVSYELYHELKLKFPTIVAYELENGVKIPAGWLIEQCGWKGKIIGKLGCYEKQALVIVNYGGATGIQLKQHALNVKKSVYTKFGILLQAEVNIF